MTAAWNGGDTLLLAAVALALGVIVLLIAWGRIAAFLAIMLGAGVFAAVVGLPFEKLTPAFEHGAGGVLGDIGVVIALGAMLGSILTAGGAADRIVDGVLQHATARSLPWLLALVAMLIGLPLFFEVGLVLMIPIIFSLAQKTRLPVMQVAIPALAGMTTLHALVPPHPGPLIGIAQLHADLGLTLVLGLVIAVPAVALAGPLYGRFIGRHPALLEAGRDGAARDGGHDAAWVGGAARPSFTLSLTVLLLPVALMLCRTVAQIALGEGPVRAALLTVGEPIMALAISVVVAALALGWGRGASRAEVGEAMRAALPPIAILLLTIGAGGGFKQVLVEAGITGTLGKIAHDTGIPLVLLAWLIAVCLRQATGSATVATTAVAGLMAPLVGDFGLTAAQTSLLVLSIGSGSVFFCHVNDAGFWMVREFFGLRLGQTVLVWSVLQSIVAVTGLVLTALLWAPAGWMG
ncbi:GntP family permease [Roseomonas elaeocarpi]|uniref:GntP family permease n=1 Tax=Roseomonas elaeocarpi TaxID=907779 RepID=A0ABV6JTH5_9PROT